MSQHFDRMDENPNVSGGCLCSDIGTQDSKGPFIVFNATEMETNISAFPVLCAPCAERAFGLVIEDELPKAPPAGPRRRKRSQAVEDGPEI